MYNRGFTLIELIAVILLIAIVAVSVAPKFDGTASYEAHTHRAQLIAALRLTQQRAMQQTDSTETIEGNYCHQIVFDVSLYGIPDRVDCSNTSFPTPIKDWIPDGTGHKVDDRYQITFNINGQVNPKSVGFDWMGRPTGDCITGGVVGCEINIIHPSEKSLKITIEAEGYIHVFDLP